MSPTRAILDGLCRMRALWPPAAAVLLAGGLAALTAGCNEAEHYETLSFFFDGVPKPGEEGPRPQQGQEPQEGPEPTSATGSPRPRQVVYVHEPYNDRQCTGCHSRLFARDLAAPKEELCDGCHPGRKEVANVHGPVAAGACLGCHDPHRSDYEHLLLAPAKDLCLRCHDATYDARTDYHRGHEEHSCVACHDAHTTTTWLPDRKPAEQGAEESPVPTAPATGAEETEGVGGVSEITSASTETGPAKPEGNGADDSGGEETETERTHPWQPGDGKQEPPHSP